MTLEQIKNDYVRENYLVSHDLDTWFEFQNYFASRHPEWFEQHWHNVLELVQKECLKRASSSIDYKIGSAVYRYVTGSITNENNLIK